MSRARSGRIFQRSIAGSIGAIGLCVLSTLVDPSYGDGLDGAGARPIDRTMRGDAALMDVFFLNHQVGWAVGERGVIWHTEDGGANWHEQVSNVSCRLSSICFVDERHGWIVGGAGEPYADATRGVVLRTKDGGVTWTTVSSARLPALARVKFFDTTRGIATGDGSSVAPSGVFVTQDRGETWLALPAGEAGYWPASDFIDASTGAVGGAGGRFATVVERRVHTSPLAGPSLRSMRAIRLTAPVGGWAVGEGGLVMTTRDLGHSWQMAPGELPDGVSDYFDFHAVALHGPEVWVAGAPGTRVFHSPDNGTTWHSFATGHPAPLRAMSFIDGEHGWAVGELGTILSTRDGGRTWQEQRAGGKRAALVGLFGRASDVPLELIAEQGAEEGYLSAVNLLFANRSGRGAPPDGGGDARVREAMVLAGATSASVAWRFPLANNLALSPPDIIAALDRASDGRAMERIENHLVRELRMWRPDVVVTQHGASPENSPIATLMEQLVRQAIEGAGDSARHTAMASQAGLDPWQVKKVYGLLGPNVRGDEVVNTARFAPRLGAMLVDWSAPARQLADEEHLQIAPPDLYGLALMEDRTNGAEGPRGIFRGISLSFGGEARRPTANMPVDNLEALRRLATRRKHLRELVERTEGNAAWAGQVAEMIEGLGDEAGGELLYQLADGYRSAGRLDLAADSLYLLARRFPEHPLTSRALVWLVQFYASHEAAHRSGGAGKENMRQVGATMSTVGDAFGATTDGGDGGFGESRVVQLGAHAPLDPSRSRHDAQPGDRIPAIVGEAKPVVGLSREDRLRRAVELGKYLEGARAELFGDPVVRFPLVIAERQLGFANPAKRFFLTLAKLPENDPWRRCAETEQWFANPEGLPPSKTLGSCRPALERPHLDGMLDEAFWESTERLRLKGGGDLTGTVRLAYDRDFLYLAVECAQMPQGDYATGGGARPRDADLSAHDRVVVRLDIDRDYTTSFEFVVDHRGWTYDACWGDASWNPTWYVAAAGDGATWIVEAAIPHAQLVEEAPAPKHVWAVAIDRTVPQVGQASWSGAESDEASPDRFGLLIFE